MGWLAGVWFPSWKRWGRHILEQLLQQDGLNWPSMCYARTLPLRSCLNSVKHILQSSNVNISDRIFGLKKEAECAYVFFSATSLRKPRTWNFWQMWTWTTFASSRLCGSYGGKPQWRAFFCCHTRCGASEEATPGPPPPPPFSGGTLMFRN
jgi:hypothetical protein